MSLELKSAKADALARELAAATGEDVETAVERAIEERLARTHRPPAAPRRAEIEDIFERLARMPVRDSRSAEQILGYDDNGLLS